MTSPTSDDGSNDSEPSAIDASPSTGSLTLTSVDALLPPGGVLDEARASAITARSLSRIIVVSGIADSGKTTLLTSIYDRFHSGPISDFYFAGSESILGFEEWCHDARLESGRTTPETLRSPHTSPGETRFLHLRIAVPDRAVEELSADAEWTKRDLIFTDLQGEVFERVRDNSEAAARMTVIGRSDHFVQLFDGERLRSLEERHGVIADGKQILRSCIAAGVLHERSTVHLVATKWDIFKGAAEEQAVGAFFDHSMDQIEKAIASSVGAVRRFRTAARAPIAAELDEWGVAPMLREWFEASKQVSVAVDAGPMPTMRSEFDRFAVREQA